MGIITSLQILLDLRLIFTWKMTAIAQRHAYILTNTKKNPRRSVIYGGREATIGPQAKLEHYQRALAYADIKLTVLSDEGAEIMRNVAQRPETPADVIRLHSEKFIRRVHFPVKPF
jgi:hypothetical protein